MSGTADELAPYILLEALTAKAMRAADPAMALRALADDERLPARLRAPLRSLDPVGVRMSGLLIAKLRFEHLINGSTHARSWFDRDPAGFARAFRAYHQACPPTAALPDAEALAFDAWVAARDTSQHE